MASKRNHIAKALKNEAALRRFNFDADQYDWYITMTFYAGVHWIRAYLASGGLFVGDRDEVHYDDFPRHVREVYRVNHGTADTGADEMLDNFHSLKRLSQRARYGCMSEAWYAQRTGDADSALKAICTFVGADGVDISERQP